MQWLVEQLWEENEELKWQNFATPPVNNEQIEVDAQSAWGVNAEELEKKRLHDELRSLVDKYEEMSRKIGGSSSVEQLLNQTDLSYSDEVMAIQLLPKFKVH